MNAATTILPQAELAAHRPQLMKFALLRLRNRASAEDAVQDTLVAALEGARRFAGESSVRTWLMGILQHKIVDHFRRQGREPRVEPREEGDGLESLEHLFREDGGWQAAPADWGDPEAVCGRRELLEALERGLARLPEKTARAFHLREVMGLSTEEICQSLGISAQNCWIMLYRARMSLRRTLEEHFAERACK
jgi:RNA polymerase sigma-70 factor (ECF subfamily)